MVCRVVQQLAPEGPVLEPKLPKYPKLCSPGETVSLNIQFSHDFQSETPISRRYFAIFNIKGSLDGGGLCLGRFLQLIVEVETVEQVRSCI